VYACAVLCVRVCLRDARVCVCVFARMCTFTCVRACVCVCARAREQTRDAHGRTIPCRDFAVRAKFEAALPAATEQISIIGQPCTSAGFCFSALATTRQSPANFLPRLCVRYTHLHRSTSVHVPHVPTHPQHTRFACANTHTACTGWMRMCECRERTYVQIPRHPASLFQRWSSASELMLLLRVDLTDWPLCNTR